jgi:hypothetical protein
MNLTMFWALAFALLIPVTAFVLWVLPELMWYVGYYIHPSLYNHGYCPRCGRRKRYNDLTGQVYCPNGHIDWSG